MNLGITALNVPGDDQQLYLDRLSVGAAYTAQPLVDV
jgi:hypothetical protein